MSDVNTNEWREFFETYGEKADWYWCDVATEILDYIDRLVAERGRYLGALINAQSMLGICREEKFHPATQAFTAICEALAKGDKTK